MRPLLLTADGVGGVWQYTADLATALQARGQHAVIALMGPAPAPFVPPGVEVVTTGLPLDWTAPDEAALDRAGDALAALARRIDSSGVHLHAPALIGEAPWPVPVVAVAHSCVGTWWSAVKGGALPDDLAWRAARTGRGLRRAAAAVVPTASFGAALRRVYGALDLHVVHNGRASGPALLRALEPHALTAGRLWDAGKAVDALDRAAAHVPIRAAGPTEGPGASLRFHNLHLLGTLDAGALARERARAACFVSVPRYEPFGLAVLEAAQSGLPLVLSDIPTFRELWDGAAAFVADEAALVPTLRRVLAEPGDLGPRARARAARYTVAAMADATLALHRTLSPEFAA